MAKGQQVLYKKDNSPIMIPNDVYRFSELWNNDQHTKHYLERIHDTIMILENIIDITKFVKYHSPKNIELLEKLK